MQLIPFDFRSIQLKPKFDEVRGLSNERRDTRCEARIFNNICLQINRKSISWHYHKKLELGLRWFDTIQAPITRKVLNCFKYSRIKVGYLILLMIRKVDISIHYQNWKKNFYFYQSNAKNLGNLTIFRISWRRFEIWNITIILER